MLLHNLKYDKNQIICKYFKIHTFNWMFFILKNIIKKIHINESDFIFF